jgi:hypothetical protein
VVLFSLSLRKLEQPVERDTEMAFHLPWLRRVVKFSQRAGLNIKPLGINSLDDLTGKYKGLDAENAFCRGKTLIVHGEI